MVGDEVTVHTLGGLCERFGLVVKHFEEDPPDPKTEKVEIPFGQDIDITDMLGEVAFSNRSMRIDFLALCGGEEFHALVSEVAGYLHGRRALFELSFDPGYYYEGRFTVTDVDYSDRRFGAFTLQVDVDPWKIQPDREYTFNAYPAVTKSFESGRKPARPEVTTQQDVYVTFAGDTETFPEGTHSSANLAFTWGTNVVTFQCKDWWFYQTGNTLVVNDEFISSDGEGIVILDDEVVRAFSSPVLTLDDDKQMVTVRYSWRDI